ncbi:signal peptidase II [Paenibacillus flagellatus]|uniref:Lipoprotein signal peptidase n=1 Tax=Paenibacillus flagellatus TaxID=2211139 RepID=A0A2V5KSF5_9BACL|nr:signal peptidase II [Paenibacillus flagellatus]PYI54557.1 signal peptidase II [Paenibacillus flagellatus]
MIYYVYALIVFILDQITKRLVVVYMEEYESRSVIGDFFMLTSHRNRGAAFGILQNQRWFFIIATTIVVIGIVWYLQKLRKSGEPKKLLKTALGLLLGGAIGNFLDRALFGEVVDFMHFHFEFSLLGADVDYDFAIFNLADSAIVIGVALIFLDSLLVWRKERRGLAHEHQDQA